MQKKRTGRVQKRQRKTRGAKKDTVLQRLRRSSYRCAGAQTSRNKRVLETRRKSSSMDLLRLEGKKTMLFIESGIRVRSEKKGKKRTRGEHKNKANIPKEGFRRSSERPRSEIPLETSHVTCNIIPSKNLWSSRFPWSSLVNWLRFVRLFYINLFYVRRVGGRACETTKNKRGDKTNK